MTMRQRKLVGTVLMLLLVAVYALLAMLAAVVLQVGASKWVELLYYIVAGLLWVVPAAGLIWWMQKPDPPADAPPERR
jgi:heme/copper-type cytochrome/quinol oxidase subunit 4